MAKKEIRPIRIEGNIAYVPLTQGYEAVVDAADVPLVESWVWMSHVRRRPNGTVRAVYAVRNAADQMGKRHLVLMHRVIAETPQGMETDHVNGNGLDNRRRNLRNVTKQQNSFNQRLAVNNTSGAKGVSWEQREGKWRAQINVSGKNRHLGLFNSIEDAAAAYAKASIDQHGEFGRMA